MRIPLVMAISLFNTYSLAEPVSQHLPLPWACNASECVVTSQVRMYGYASCSDLQPWNAVFFDTLCPSQPPQGAWTTINLTPFGVSSDAKAAFLSGLLLVTQTGAGTADIHVSFRAFGSSEDPMCVKYLGQAVGVATPNQVADPGFPGVNIRSNMATWVPLNEGKFQYCYRIPNPAVSNYGINLSIQAYMPGAQAVQAFVSAKKHKTGVKSTR